MNDIRPWRVIVATAAHAGCATTTSLPPPTDDMALARAAIADAASAGAQEFAPDIMRRARDELEHGAAALAAGHHRDARRFARDAEVDARLAATTARARRAEQALAEVDARVPQWRDQAARPR